MTIRTQTRIRRDVNRVHETALAHAERPALRALAAIVAPHAEAVNRTGAWLARAAVKQNKEADERDRSVSSARKWIQTWRPVVLLVAPGAAANLRALPAKGGTPDDLARVVADYREFIDTYRSDDGQPLAFREDALAALGTTGDALAKENGEAVAALAEEEQAEAAFAAACAAALPVIVQGSRVIRAEFGATSHEYKRLVMRSTADEEAESDAITGPVPETVPR